MSTKVKDFEVYNSEIIPDVKFFKPSVFEDLRGTLYTTFHGDVFDNYIPDFLSFKHDKFSQSKQNVLRGIHGDIKSWKLVTAVYGEILQVFVDNRQDSPTYKKWDKCIINEENPMSVLLPPGIGNAFYVQSEMAVYHYKLAYSGEYLDAEDQFSMKWNDPEIGIEWPTKTPILSNRDK
jgi:dTDP-4-dehydrorhamnose 3,5-epimerase